VQVRDGARAQVDQPQLTGGRWIDAGDGVVLEDGLATTLNVWPGDTITLAGRQVPVLGTAMSVLIMPYPIDTRDRGHVWAGTATAAAIDRATVQRVQVISELRLSHPDDAPGFAQNVPEMALPEGFELSMFEFQQARRGADGKLSTIALALALTATLLAGLTISTTGVIVAERMAAQLRRVGALKAVGVTPTQVTLVLLAEYVALAAIAAAIGLGLSTLAAPLFAGQLRILYGAPEPPALTLSRALLVFAAAAALVIVATVRPALRGARQSTLRQLGGQSRPPRRSSRLAGLATRLRLPLPAVLGLRSVARRPGRTVGTVTALTLLGIPLGVLLFNALGGPTLAPAALAASTYLALALIALVVYTGIVTVPARVLAAQPITPQLSYE